MDGEEKENGAPSTPSPDGAESGEIAKEAVELFEAAEKAIEEEKLGEAESLLEKISERGAEWHYWNAVLLKKKKWYLKSLLEIRKALELDPENGKYKKELEELERMRQKGEKSRKRKDKKNMGCKSAGGSFGDDLGECCLTASCELCCTFLCEGICEGC